MATKKPTQVVIQRLPGSLAPACGGPDWCADCRKPGGHLGRGW